MAEVELPIALPIGNVFGNRDWIDTRGEKHHRCWMCTPAPPHRKGDPYIKEGYPPMPPGCTLCARCGVLIYTGQDDPENQEMAMCPSCETTITAGLDQESEPTPGTVTA